MTLAAYDAKIVMPVTSVSTPVAAAPPRPAWRIWLRRLAPWVITAVVVFFILREHPIDQIVAEMKRGTAWPLLPIGVGLSAGVLFLVGAWDFIVLRTLFRGPPYLDVVKGKAATSVLLSLGYAFGQGGYGVWIARRTGASAGQAAGATLYIMASDLAAVCLVASASMWLGGIEVSPLMAYLTPGLAALMLLFVLVGPYKMIGDPPAVFRPWVDIPRRHGLLNIAGRCFNIALFILGTFTATTAFGLDIPLDAMAIYLPVIMLVGALPINVAGFGAVQGAWLLLTPWAEGPQILAFQFLWHLCVVAGVVLRGLPFLRKTIAEIDRGAGG